MKTNDIKYHAKTCPKYKRSTLSDKEVKSPRPEFSQAVQSYFPKTLKPEVLIKS